jgi:hypothetical protein
MLFRLFYGNTHLKVHSWDVDYSDHVLPVFFKSCSGIHEGCLIQLLCSHVPSCYGTLAPAEGDGPGAVCSLLDQGLVELTTGARVDLGPAVLAVVLQTRHIGTEERGKLAPTSRPLALIAHLVIQHVRLYLNLSNKQAAMLYYINCHIQTLMVYYINQSK